MRTRRHIPVLLLIALGPASPAQSASDDTSRFARSSNAFGFDLYGRMRATPGNLVVSPASVIMGLGMAWRGARGATADQMRRFLHYEGTPDTVGAAAGRLSAALRDPPQPAVLRIANRLFGERTLAIEEGFLDATNAAYGAGPEAIDFKRTPEAARERINAWVEEQTEKKIRDLVPPRGVSRDTRLALILLPVRPDGLGAVETTLTVDQLDAIVVSLAPAQVAVSLPAFEVDPAGSLALGETLTAMGMALAFDREKADFTGIAHRPDPRDRLLIGDAFHKVYVKVDERGTEAAAATAVVMQRAPAALPPKVVEF